MRVAIRRTLRVGDEAGTELEDLGVRPNHQHQLTRNDVLHENPDLIAHAAQILSNEPIRKFDATVTRTPEKLTLKLATGNVEYVDVLVDGRPRGSRDIAQGAVQFELPENQAFVLSAQQLGIELCGYAGGKLVCYRRLQG